MNMTSKLLISAFTASVLVSSLVARQPDPKEYTIFTAENLRADYAKLTPEVQAQIKADYDTKIKLATIIRAQRATDPMFQAAIDFRALDLWSKQIASKVDVNEDKLKEVYSKQDLNVATKYKLRNILVKTDEEASAIESELSKYKGEELKAKFIAMVKDKSIDPVTKAKEGDGGWVDMSTMPKEIIDKLQNTSKMSIVHLPSIPNLGSHVILIEDINPAHKASFEEAKQHLAQMLIQSEIAKEAQALMGADKASVPAKAIKPKK